MKWIHMHESELHCFWPRTKIRKAIQKGVDHDETWSRFPITILKESDSYNEAIAFEKLCSDSDTDDISAAKSRKKKMVKNNDFVTDDVSSEDEIIDLPPKMKKIVPRGERIEIYVGDECDLRNEMIELEKKSSSDTTDTGEQMKKNVHASLEDSEDSGVLMPPPGTSYVPKQVKKAEDCNVKENSCCCVHVNKILENVVQVRTLLNEQTKVLERKYGQNLVDHVENFDSVPSDCFNKYKKLMKYEDILKNSLEAKQQLETVFYIGGGKDDNECIKRSLKRIFSNELAKKCSWTGRKGNFPLKELYVMSILKDATRKRFPSLTDKGFETRVALWFRQATLRHSREIN